MKSQRPFRFIDEASTASMELMNQSTVSISTLCSRVAASAEQHSSENAKQQAKFHEVVDEKLNHLKQVALQLGEDILTYPHLVFSPGRLPEALDALIAKKEDALALAKAQQQNRSSIGLCNDFLHGRCSRGVTCHESHAPEDLEEFIRTAIAAVKSTIGSSSPQGDSTFTVTETFGREAWGCVMRQLQHRSFSSLVVRECDAIALAAVSRCVKRNTLPSLKMLDLSQNRLAHVSPGGVLKLASSLASTTTLEGVSVAYNVLGAAGSLALVRGILRNPMSCVTSINLSGNGIVFHDAAFSLLCDAIVAAPLRKLSLAHNHLGADGVKKLMQLLATSRGPSESSSSPSPVAAAEEPTDDATASPPPVIRHQLEFLDIFATNCGDQGGNAIAQFLQTPAGRHLRFLNIGWNRLTSDSIVALCTTLENHSALEVLRLAYNLGLGRKGSIALAECIKKNPHIATLDLRWTSLGDDGAATIAEAVAGTGRHAIRSILVYGNDLDSRTEAYLGDKLKKHSSQAMNQRDDSYSNKNTSTLPQRLQPKDEIW